MNDDPLVSAAQLTVAFLLLYMACMMNVLRTKKACNRTADEQGVAFDRYNSDLMHNADRLVGNYLEWSPAFLGIVWSLAATDNFNDVCYYAGWVYIFLRGLYIYLMIAYGVSRNGLSPALHVSTFPAYACLLIMLVQAIWKLFLS